MKTKLILAVASLVSAAPVLAAVTPISGGVAAEAYASAGSIENFGPASATGWTTLQPGVAFNAFSSAVANFPGGLAGNPAFASTRMEIFSNWASATAGTVYMGWGHFIENSGEAEAGNADPEWRYQFSLSTPAELLLNWSGFSTVTAGSSTFGLGSAIMLVNDGSEFSQQLSTGGSIMGPFGSGTSTAMLAPGNYLLTLNPNHRVGAGSTIGADAQLSIDWSINPMAGAVPEPASWAMLIAGFGLVGATMRRRQRAQLRHVTA
jgi:hypothetical protein